MMDAPIRVLIVDDHEIVRQGLRTLLEPEPDLEVVGEAATGTEALATCGRLHPDVVLLDLRLPDLDGVEVCRLLRERDAGVHVLALTTYDEPDLVDRCIQAGVTGYVVKDVEQFELKRSIRLVARGEAAIDPKVGARLMERLRARPDAPLTPASPLTAQQRGILRLLSDGRSTREIAAQLGLSENTVKGYIQEIFRRLDVNNRVAAVMRASRAGWL
jgi:DNA-binding NarL/FixJ family response regulator